MARITVPAKQLVVGDRVEFATGRRVTVLRVVVGRPNGQVWLEFSNRLYGEVDGNTRYTVLTTRKGHTK